MTFGKRLKKLRKEKGLTLKDLSNKFDRSKTAFSNYENDYRKPNFELIKKLANYFGVTVDYLVDFKTSYVKENNNLKELEIIPVLEKIMPGKQILDKENIVDYKKVPYEKVKGGDYFYFKANNSSLANAGIHEGDNVLVIRQSSIKNGNIAVVMVNESSAKLKRVHINGTQLILQDGDSSTDPDIADEKDVSIIGKAIEVVHKL